jgi:chitinase
MAICQYIQVQSGDGCWALADRCGISQDDFVKYNGGPNFCDNLLPDEYACCSAGFRPDFSPKPDGDGKCFVYTIVQNDTCAKIAKANQMEIDDLPKNNKLAWGWAGCKGLRSGQKMPNQSLPKCIHSSGPETSTRFADQPLRLSVLYYSKVLA